MKTLVSGGTVVAWNGTEHEVMDGADIVIDGNTIQAVTAAPGGADVGADRIIDATGKVVTPGLINTHVHASVQSTAIATLDEGRRDLYSSGYLAYQPRKGQSRPALSPEEEEATAGFSIAGLLRHGSTTIIEMGSVGTSVEALTKVVGDYGIRAYLGPGFRSSNYEMDDDNKLQYVWDEEAGRRGLRAAVDYYHEWNGAFDGRLTAIMIPRNADTCTPELLQEAHRQATELGMRMEIHTAQSVFEFQQIVRRHGKTPVAYLADLGILGEHMILGHCVYVSGHSATAFPGDDDLKILADTGTSVAHSPLVYVRNGRCLETFARYRRAGVNVTTATDTFPQDLISEMRLASYMTKVLERDYAVGTAWELFEAATIGGAQALGRDDLGRLAPGAKADIVIWDLNNLRVGPYVDPVKALVHCATGDDVQTVLVDGLVRVENGLVNGKTAAEILEPAKPVAAKVWASRWPERFAPVAATGS